MSIFKDKKFIEILSFTELSMELVNKESENGFYHKVCPMLDNIRYSVNKMNQQLAGDKRQYYNKVVERGLENAKSKLESNGFQQPDIYDLYCLISHVRSLID